MSQSLKPEKRSDHRAENKPESQAEADLGTAESALWSIRSQDTVDRKFIDKCLKGFDRLLARDDVGFTRIAARDSLVQAAEARAREIARSSTHMVIIGMGGSSLGTRALLGAVPRQPGRGAVSFL